MVVFGLLLIIIVFVWENDLLCVFKFLNLSVDGVYIKVFFVDFRNKSEDVKL